MIKVFVTIIAAPGTFEKVSQTIYEHPYSPKTRIGYCDDVVGFCDVIVEFYYDGTLEEFYDDVIKEINQMKDVNKVTSYAVYHSFDDKQTDDEIMGYLFIGVLPMFIESLHNELYKKDRIVSSNIIDGESDILAITTCPLSQLSDFTAEIQRIIGLKWSNTCIPHDVLRNVPE